MKENKGIIIAAIIGVCAIACTVIGVLGFTKYKMASKATGVSATGSASCDFESDLIVWRGSFTAEAPTTTTAYSKIKNDAQLIKEYLEENGISDDEVVFSSVNIWQNTTPQYNEAGDYIGEIKGDYSLSQDVEITSKDVERVEQISRDISALIEAGVNFSSYAPEYYYTKLDELKLDLIQKATDNAKQRVEIMTASTGSKPGDLLSANLGVFQITAQNSAADEYSYGGTFNTSSKNKTASITVKLNYSIR